MIRALFAACLALSLSASAQEVVRPLPTVTQAQASAVVGALKALPGERLGQHPLVQAVISLRFDAPESLQKLAPIVAALQGSPATPESARAALIAASIDASQQAQALTARYLAMGEKAGQAELAAYAQDAERFQDSYSLYLSIHDGAAIHGFAKQARERATMAGARRTAEELGTSKQTDGVAGAGASGKAAGSLEPSTGRETAPSAGVPKPASAPAQPAPARRFTLAGAAYYLGGALVMVALLLIPGMNAASLGTGGLFFVTVAYGGLFAAAGSWLKDKGNPVAGGILATAALVAVPIAVGLAETWAGLWNGVEPRMNVDVLVAAIAGSVIPAAVALGRKFKFGFLSMPAAVAAAVLLGVLIDAVSPDQWMTQHVRLLAGAYGAGLLGVASWLDKKWPEPKYGGWLAGMASAILFGTLLGWGNTEGARLAVAAASAGLIGLGAVIDRRVLAVFGGLGVAAYVCHLLGIWAGTALFPFAMIAAGLSILGGAALFQKKFAGFQSWLKARLGR